MVERAFRQFNRQNIREVKQQLNTQSKINKYFKTERWKKKLIFDWEDFFYTGRIFNFKIVPKHPSVTEYL